MQQGLKKRLFVDVPGEAVNDPKEEEANTYAQETLIPRTAWQAFVQAADFSQGGIVQFARLVKVTPGIVVGQLQHFGHLPWNSHLTRLKTRFAWERHETERRQP